MTTPETHTYPFDSRALTEPVDRRAVASFWRKVRAQHPTPAGAIFVRTIFGVIAVIALVPMVSILIFGTLSSDHSITGTLGLPILLFCVIAVAGTVIGVVTVQRTRLNAYRLSRFAAANGMTYEHEVVSPPLPGMIFHAGDSRVASMLLRGRSPRFVEFGNFRYTTGSGKSRTTHRWGYVAVKLDVPLPNIVLDARGNNALGTNLPQSFSRSQRLSLEGDFDRYFTLYCPQGYEADALYLFTPDIMTRFIDNAAQLDVEIVDDWMFLYMQRSASTTDVATWAWLFSTVGALMTKFDQWSRWRDERLRAMQAMTPVPPAGVAATPASPVPASATQPAALPFAAPAGLLSPPPGVAPEGQRLRRGVSRTSIVLVLAVFAFGIVPRILSAIGLLPD